jgi:hypothetical protein
MFIDAGLPDIVFAPPWLPCYAPLCRTPLRLDALCAAKPKHLTTPALMKSRQPQKPAKHFFWRHHLAGPPRHARQYQQLADV